ncbi:MAP7 domain-containing protein 3 isoform X16 [Chelonia mydas]|uniref:MAP7 domain-containing protein 3 isoform X16 n=1 Tax=Chelonia mydas TaxID=8469 RepID=UPI0018A22985|nr:MAP7 domain-containing protein 3 isoform X16 [Chelonia mydas]
MAEGGGSSLKGLREQMVAAAQAIAEERRNQSGISPVPVQTAINIKTATKPVIDGSTLRTEERQRLARERREEREKQNAAKETQIFEKEKKAKLQYEKQMEEKQRKLKEQKQKEEQRRAAVEEKRKQKIEAEKERYEAVVHRTLERSQRLETRQKRWSWGGSVTSNSDSKTEPQTADEGGAANKRSTSTANLKQTEAVISKRLSSSAALLNSPDRSTTKRSASLNRLSNKVSLQSEQPPPKGSQVEQKGGTEKKRSTSLNRISSKPHSSPELEKVKKEERPASASSISSPIQTPKVPVRSRSIDRLKTTVSSSDTRSPESAQKSETEKQSPSPAGRRPPSPSISARRRSPSPANLAKRPSSPSTARQNQKARPPSPSVLKQRPSSPTTVSKPAPIQRLPLTPSVMNITKKKPEMECKPKDKCEEGAGQEHGTSPTSERETVAIAAKTKEESSSKTIPGTTTAEEAAKILAEKRRLAREQREREDQERIQREEEERSREEEMVKKMIEDKVQREEALQRLEEEKRLDDEEQQRQAEERVRKEQEEQEKLREEAEAKAQEEAERQRQERERIMQQNMQERLERKKRIEEIMKRTRKSDQNEAKNEEKSANEGEEEDDAEEEGELGLEKTYQPALCLSEKINGVDMSQEIKVQTQCSSEFACGLTSMESSMQDMSKMEADEVLMNGDEQNIYQKETNERSLHVTQLKGYSPSAKEMVIPNSEILHINETDHTIGLIQNLNGKSNAWTFEEIIDLGVHSKSTKLSSDSITADNCNENLNDAATVPSSPKLAFEDDGMVNSLTKPIETASEL